MAGDRAPRVAEPHVGGKAASAEYERDQVQWVFDVEVVKGKEIIDVTVDPATGRVLAATADKADHEEEGGEQAD